MNNYNNMTSIIENILVLVNININIPERVF